MLKDHIRMLALIFLLLIPSLYLASGAFIDFELTTQDPNRLTLECYSSSTGFLDDDAIIQFFNSTRDGAEPLGNISSGGVFDITAENEAFLRCTSSDGNSQSELVAIAAVPTAPPTVQTHPTEKRTQIVNIFNAESANLTCPIPLGNLYDHLEPYTFSWEISYEQSGPYYPVNPSMSSRYYSSNNRSLRVLVNNATRSNSYRCVLRLRRCDIIGYNNEPQCPVKTYYGSSAQIEVFERSRVILGPVLKEVHLGELAQFICVGAGSFVNISWQYAEVCSTCGKTVVVSNNVSRRDQRINSTLTINTSMLRFEGEFSATVGCVLHQSIPPEYNLQGRESQSVLARLVVAGTPWTMVMDPLPSPGYMSHQAYAYVGGSVLVIICVLLVLLTAILILVISLRRTRKKPHTGHESPAPSPLYEQVLTTTGHSGYRDDWKCRTTSSTDEKLPHIDVSAKTNMEELGDGSIADAMNRDEIPYNNMMKGLYEVESSCSLTSDPKSGTNTPKGQLARIPSETDSGVANEDLEQVSEYERVQYDETTMQFIMGVVKPYERVSYKETMEQMVKRMSREDPADASSGRNSETTEDCEPYETISGYERVQYSKEALQMLRRMPDVICSDDGRQTCGLKSPGVENSENL